MANAFGAAKDFPIALRHTEIVGNFISNPLILRRSHEKFDNMGCG
jgi:hypothetical protein